MKRAWSRKNIWNATPRPIKAALGAVLSRVPLPLLLGKKFRDWYGFLDAAQWWDAQRIREYQLSQLREILKLAYEKTIYYRRTFDAAGFQPGDLKDLADLHGLPTIDKTTVRENLNEMRVMPLADSARVDYMSTSGSGGTPLGFYINADRSAVEFAHLSHCWARVGYRPGMSLAVFRGSVIESVTSGMHYEHDPLLRHHVYSSFHLGEEDVARYFEHLHRVRPDFIHAYPSSATTLAQFAARRGESLPSSIKAVLLESEPVYDHQRQLMSEHLGIRVYTSYGHTEKLVMAGECEHSNHYHVWPTYGYCELLDTQGNQVGQGERGEIVGTGFINRVVPFIRYRTDDFATHVGTSCPHCKRNHLLISGVLGHRTQEFLVTRNRTVIAWTALNMHDDTFEGILHFQFVQNVAGQADLYIVPEEGIEKVDLPRMQAHLEGKLRDQIEVAIRICERIEPSASGKQPIVKQNTPGIEKLFPAFELTQNAASPLAASHHTVVGS